MRSSLRVLAVAAALWCVTAHDVQAQICPDVPPVVRNLDVPRFYSDAAGTKVDPLAAAAHAKAVEPLNAFVRQVTQDADKALRRGSPKSQLEVAVCALAWLETWARGDAWLGTMSTQQAEYQRKWDLAGVALAYLKLQRFATAEQRAAIEPWLQRFADVCRAFFDAPERSRNNHWYWLGLGAAAVGLATNSPRHWDMARGIMRDAASDVRADGAIPKELERQARALYYHTFALVPLVVMAELAASRGEDWYALGDGALHRLASLTHAGLKQPALFLPLAGLVQEPDTNPRAGWLQLYSARFPGRLVGPHPDVAEGNRWIGGNVLVLKAVIDGKL
jgi:poly(beta-D-mannuronate) lyase